MTRLRALSRVAMLLLILAVVLYPLVWVLGSSLKTLGDEGPEVPLGFGQPADIGELLL